MAEQYWGIDLGGTKIAGVVLGPTDDVPVAAFGLGGHADAAERVRRVRRAEDHTFDFGAAEVDAPVLVRHALNLSPMRYLRVRTLPTRGIR